MVESHLILKPLFRPAMNLAVAIYLSGTIPFSYVCDVQKKRVISQEVPTQDTLWKYINFTLQLYRRKITMSSDFGGFFWEDRGLWDVE